MIVKTFNVIVAACIFAFGGCSTPYKRHKVVICNPADAIRDNELVIFSRKEFKEQLKIQDRFISISVNDKEQSLQFDDLDGDGNWDEAAMLYSFKPKEAAVFIITGLGQRPNTTIGQVAHVRMRKKKDDNSFGPVITEEFMPLHNPATDFSKHPLPPYLTEGPAWENDKVGFRLYFDVRNGKDIWGKRTEKMILDEVGVKVEPSYHELQDWGMDVLHAGKSLGAGSLAFLTPINGKDSLVRLGGNIVSSTQYKVIADGPIRAMFTLDYKLELMGKKMHVRDEMSIWGGQYYYQSKVTVVNAPAGTRLVTGIASFYQKDSFSTDTAGYFIGGSYGVQSENKDMLGMAVGISHDQFSSFEHVNDTLAVIDHSYLIAQKIGSTPNIYRFYACWEKSNPAFATEQGFKDYIRKQAIIGGESLIYRYE